MKLFDPVKAEQLLHHAQVDGVIKIRAADFVNLPAGDSLLHVNAMPCTHRAGHRYLMAMICGRAEDGQPLLDARTAELVTIDEVWVVDRPSRLAPAELGRLIGRPANHDDLHELLAERYASTRGIGRQAAAQMSLMVSAIRRSSLPA
jgi:hypothetical protein